MTHNAHNFPHVHEVNAINVNELGCVMLPLEPFNALAGSLEGLLLEEDLYTTSNPERWWIKGNVASEGAHVTLLYGLLTKAYHQPDLIREVLDGWEFPAELRTQVFEVFPSPFPDEPYGCVVARLEAGGPLADAHGRLSYLPHIDTHPEYKPHVTIAYVRRDRAQEWVDLLNLTSSTFTPDGELDLGER